jgi:N utilization substance protein B
MLPSENFIGHVEEHFINWDDDAEMMNILIQNFLQKPGAYDFNEMLSKEKWDFAKFHTDLDCCRLHQAVQFLGWSRNWSAPPEHAQDWLDEALAVATRLRL